MSRCPPGVTLRLGSRGSREKPMGHLCLEQGAGYKKFGIERLLATRTGCYEPCGSSQQRVHTSTTAAVGRGLLGWGYHQKNSLLENHNQMRKWWCRKGESALFLQFCVKEIGLTGIIPFQTNMTYFMFVWQCILNMKWRVRPIRCKNCNLLIIH